MSISCHVIPKTSLRRAPVKAYLTADSAYGSAESLAWLVKQKKITPHIPVFDKSTRTDGTFSRADFTFDPERDRYTCPAGKELVHISSPSARLARVFGGV